jgi:hypothetical protein
MCSADRLGKERKEVGRGYHVTQQAQDIHWVITMRLREVSMKRERVDSHSLTKLTNRNTVQVCLKNVVFWGMKPCGWVDSYHHFGGQ